MGACARCAGATPALAFVHFPRAAFQWLGGKPARYRSSGGADRGFCPTCGSSVSVHEGVLGDRVQVTVGSLHQPDRGQIDDHVWTESQIAWFEIDDALPRFRKSNTAVPTLAGPSSRLR